MTNTTPSGGAGQVRSVAHTPPEMCGLIEAPHGVHDYFVGDIKLNCPGDFQLCAFCGEPKNDHAVMSAEVCILTTAESEVIAALKEFDAAD
jgi:hypothetical protein